MITALQSAGTLPRISQFSSTQRKPHAKQTGALGQLASIFSRPVGIATTTFGKARPVNFAETLAAKRSSVTKGLIATSDQPLDDTQLILQGIKDYIWDNGDKAQTILDYDGTLVAKRCLYDCNKQPTTDKTIAEDIDTSDPAAAEHIQTLIRNLATKNPDKVKLNILTARDFMIDWLPSSKPIHQMYTLLPVLKELYDEKADVVLTAMMGGYNVDFSTQKIKKQPNNKEIEAAEWVFNQLKEEGLINAEHVNNNPLFYQSSDGQKGYVEVKSAALVLHPGFLSAEGENKKCPAKNHPLYKRFIELMNEASKEDNFGVEFKVHNSGGESVSEIELVPGHYQKGKALLNGHNHKSKGQVPIYAGDSSSDVSAINAAIDEGGLGIFVHSPEEGQTVAEMIEKYELNKNVLVVPNHNAMVELLDNINTAATTHQKPVKVTA
jgi:hypothetical protein